MSSSQNITLPINSVPTHIVVWQEQKHNSNSNVPSNTINTDAVLNTVLIEKLTERVGALERMVKQLADSSSSSSRVRTVSDILGMNRPLWNSPSLQGFAFDDNSSPHTELSSIADDKDNKSVPKRSPYFTATAVPEPVGLDVLHSVLPSEVVSVEGEGSSSEVFSHLMNTLSRPEARTSVRTVNVNGVPFAIHKWNDSVIYCDESTGRAFVNPNDAFENPSKHSIGYWDSVKNLLIPSESLEEEKESVKEEIPAQEDNTESVEEVVEEQAEQEQAEQEQAEQKHEEAEEEQEEAEEEQEEEQEEEEEGEAMELEEFEYKGQTYYKDADNQVYQIVDGELDDTPIGVWNDQKQKVLKYPKN